MPFAKNIMQGGVSAGTADAINGQIASGLTAAGTTQGTALLISADTNLFSTVGSGAGAVLYAGQSGDSCDVYNGGANALAIYPPSGSRFNQVAVNGSISLGTSTMCTIRIVSATQCIVNLSA